ncbi:MAG: cupredoxin domain-containing protein [bacterium]
MKPIIISTILAVFLIFFALRFSPGKIDPVNIKDSNNVSVVDGKQIIEINAKGGYSPRETLAKAGVPTVVKVITNSTYDCSSALSIPAINFRKNLPLNGETLVDIPAQNIGSEIQGLCGMGMYNFKIKFN